MPSEFVYHRRVQFAETDMAGVMHFANYFRLMEEAEHGFWRSLGLSVVMRGEGGTGLGGPAPQDEHAAAPTISWPRVAVSCEYLAPARFDDPLELTVRLERVGDKSLTVAVDFERGAEKLASGKMKVVCCEMRGGVFRSIAIPEAIRARLQA